MNSKAVNFNFFRIVKYDLKKNKILHLSRVSQFIFLHAPVACINYQSQIQDPVERHVLWRRRALRENPKA